MYHFYLLTTVGTCYNKLRSDLDILFDIIRNLLKSMLVKKRVYGIFNAFVMLVFSFGKINLKKRGYREEETIN